MEQRPSLELAKPSNEVYQFRHVDPEKDAELLQAITLSPGQIDEQWTEELDRLIDTGSARINPSSTTLEERDAIVDARVRYAEKLGLDNSNHPLHKAYTDIVKYRSSGVVPLHLVNTLRAIAGLAGNPVEAVHMVQRKPGLLANKGPVLTRRRTYLHRLAAVLKWQGDVDDLLKEEPEIWAMGDDRITVLGQIAARFGKAKDRQLSNRSVALIVRGPASIESRLNGALHYSRKQYTLRRRRYEKERSGSQRERLYASLSKAPAVARLGPRILRAYFRYHTPDAAAQKRLPKLRHLIPPSKRIDKEVSAENVSRVITGDEVWLSETSVPETPRGRKTWLTKVNIRLARGSAELGRRSGTPAYEAVLNHRIHFFRLLGWTSPRHTFGKAFEKFSINQPSLVAPSQAVAVMNVLVSHGVKSAFEPLLLGHFRVLVHSPDSIAEKLEVIAEEGFEVNEIIHSRTTILKESPEVIRGLLRRRTQRATGQR